MALREAGEDLHREGRPIRSWKRGRRPRELMMADSDDIERLRSTIRVLHAAVDAALDNKAPLAVLKSLTLKLLERQRRLAALEWQDTALRDDIGELRSMIDSALDSGANAHLLQAMADVLRGRREQLEARQRPGELGAGR